VMFGAFPGGFMGGSGRNGVFQQKFTAYPPSFLETERPQVEAGDKIIMPSSCLDALARLRITYPMLFEVTNETLGRRTHCGVLEFIAPEGMIYLPSWMMQNLFLEPGDKVTLKSVTLPKGTFVKLRPQTKDFLEIANPKATLENRLRAFSALTAGDTIVINHASKNYALDICEVRPGDAMTIIEADVNVDFEAPLDHEDGLMGAEARAHKAAQQVAAAPGPEVDAMDEDVADVSGVKAFSGSGFSLSGKRAPSSGGKSTTYAARPKPIERCKGGMAQRIGDELQVVPAGGAPKSSTAVDSDEEDGIDYSTARFHVFGGTGWR